MLVQAIKDIFKEYGVGIASNSDLQTILLLLGYDIRSNVLIPNTASEARPMVVASGYRNILSKFGFTPADIDRILPPEVSGPVTMTDLKLGLIKLGTDYAGPDGATIAPVPAAPTAPGGAVPPPLPTGGGNVP